MNSRAFSCGVMSVDTQPPGKGVSSCEESLTAPLTCRSVNTTRPQASSGAPDLPTGVLIVT